MQEIINRILIGCILSTIFIFCTINDTFHILVPLAIIGFLYDFYYIHYNKNIFINKWIILLYLYTFLGITNAIFLISKSTSIVAEIITIITLSDITQYFFGKWLKNALFNIGKINIWSPNKSAEGYVCSYFTILTFVYYTRSIYTTEILLRKTPTLFSSLILISFLVFVGWIGDIFISFIKRRLKIKDISNLLGKHGGLLDRLDGILLGVIAVNIIY